MSMKVNEMYRIAYPQVSPRGQKYMLLNKSEAIEVYKALGEALSDSKEVVEEKIEISRTQFEQAIRDGRHYTAQAIARKLGFTI
jgi:hypothetical protein